MHLPTFKTSTTFTSWSFLSQKLRWMARASLCKYFECNIVLVLTLLYCHDVNAVSFQNVLVFLLTCHWYSIRQGQVSKKTSIILSLSSSPIKQSFKTIPIHACDPRHWNETASVMFSRGASSYDRNKMVLSFPMVWPNFFIHTFTWYFQCSDINWISSFASAR